MAIDPTGNYGDIRTGGGESGNDTLRIVHATDALVSVQAGGIARQTNPTAFADAAASKFASDDLGRQLIRVQARDLIQTARATFATGTETALFTATAATYSDLIFLTAANNSNAAVQIDIRCTSAGNILHTLSIPASGGADWSPTIPYPQDATGNAWTIDLPDITGTTVSVSALFSKEI